MELSTVIIHFETIAGKPLSFVDDWIVGRGLFDRAVVYARESTPSQRRNLHHQLEQLFGAVRSRGIEVLEEIGVVESGRTLDRQYRRGLHRALDTAKESGAIVIANNLDRIIRPPEGLESADIRPSDLRTLGDQSIVIATLLEPTATTTVKRSEETKRGMTAKSKGGRSPANEALIMELATRPMSVRQIAKEAGVSRRCVRDVMQRNGINPELRALRLGGEGA